MLAGIANPARSCPQTCLIAKRSWRSVAAWQIQRQSISKVPRTLSSVLAHSYSRLGLGEFDALPHLEAVTHLEFGNESLVDPGLEVPTPASVKRERTVFQQGLAVAGVE